MLSERRLIEPRVAFGRSATRLLQNLPIFLFSMNASVIYVPVRSGTVPVSVAPGGRHRSRSVAASAMLYLSCSAAAYYAYCGGVPENVVDAWPHLLGSGSLRQSSAVPRAAGGRRWDLRSTCKSFPVAPHLGPRAKAAAAGWRGWPRLWASWRWALRPPSSSPGPLPFPCGHCLPLRHGAALRPSRTRRAPLQWQRGGARVFPRWHCLRGSLPSGPLRGPGI